MSHDPKNIFGDSPKSLERKLRIYKDFLKQNSGSIWIGKLIEIDQRFAFFCIKNWIIIINCLNKFKFCEFE